MAGDTIIDLKDSFRSITLTFTEDGTYNLSLLDDEGRGLAESGSYSATSLTVTMDPSYMEAFTLNYFIIGHVLTMSGSVGPVHQEMRCVKA